MKKIFLFLILVSVFVFAEELKVETNVETGIEEGYLIYYKFNEGEEINYLLTIENYGQLIVAGKYNEKTDRGKIILNQKVKKVEDEIGVVEVVYKKGVWNNENVSLTEKKAILKMNKNGEVIESEGLQEIAGEFFKIIQKGIASYIPGADRLPLKIDFSKMSSELFNASWESMRPIFPDKKLKIGDFWEREILIPILFTKGKLTYTLIGLNGNNAYINMYYKKGSLTLKGKGIFDIEKGYLISEEFTINLENINEKLDLSKYVGTNTPPIPIQGKTKITFKLNFLE